MDPNLRAPAANPLLERIWRGLGGVRLFFWLAGLVLLTLVIGSVLPQNTPLAGLEERLGAGLVGFLERAGLNQVFSQWWFVSLLGLLALNLAACSIRCLGKLRGAVWTTHLGLLVILAGGMITGIRGERVSLRLVEGHASDMARGKAGPVRLPFAVRLEKFTIDYYEPESHRLVLVAEDGETVAEFDPAKGGPVKLSPEVRVSVSRVYPSFVVTAQGPANRPGGPHNPAALAEVFWGGEKRGAFLFENFAPVYRAHREQAGWPLIHYRHRPGRIRQFISRLTILEDGQAVREGEIFVNRPLSWAGYRLYQSGYDSEQKGVSILQVSRDPGVPVVYLGFIILPVGLLWSLLGRKERE